LAWFYKHVLETFLYLILMGRGWIVGAWEVHGLSPVTTQKEKTKRKRKRKKLLL